jgi:hypothetical protein
LQCKNIEHDCLNNRRVCKDLSHDKQKYCTKLASIQILAIPGNSGRLQNAIRQK